MTDKKFEPVNLIPWLLLAGLFFMLAEARSTELDVRQSNDMNNQTSGSVITEGSKALGLGFAYGMGDVDINDCLVSTQNGNIIFGKQGFEYNLWCMGEVYDAKGLYKMGARMRCDIDVVRIHFDDDSSCLAANEVGGEVTASPVLDSLYDQAARFEETEEHHEEELEVMQQQQQQIVERMDSYDRQRRRAAEAERAYNEEFLEKFKGVTGNE